MISLAEARYVRSSSQAQTLSGNLRSITQSIRRPRKLGRRFATSTLRLGLGCKRARRKSWNILAADSDASSSTKSPDSANGAIMRRLLSKETLARGYYDDNELPGVLVHMAYLREPTECMPFRDLATRSVQHSGDRWELGTDLPIGGAKYQSARQADVAHFEALCRALPEACREAGGDADDLRASWLLPLEALPGAASEGLAAAAARGGWDRALPGHSGDGAAAATASVAAAAGARTGTVEVTARYQQFTEFSSYTFHLPLLSEAQEGAEGLVGGLEQGEALVQYLQSLEGCSWWAAMPGDLFLVAVIAAAPAPVAFTSPSSPAASASSSPFSSAAAASSGSSFSLASLDPEPIQRVFTEGAAAPRGNEALVGCQLAEGSIGLFANYALQPRTEHLHVGVLYDGQASAAEQQRFARVLQTFLELEEYRLLTLSATKLAKNLLAQLGLINEQVLEMLGALGADGRGGGQVKDLLAQICALQNACETLGVQCRNRFVACDNYGKVVQRRLQKMRCRKVEGFRNYETFVWRRVEPALRTYTSSRQRLDETTAAIERAAALLRTQVETEVQTQNWYLVIIGTVLTFSSLGISIAQLLEDLYGFNFLDFLRF